MLPIAGHRRSSCGGEVVAAAVRLRQFDAGRDRPDRRRRCCAFLVGLAAHALIAVLARAFYARQDTRTPVAAAILAVVVNTTLAVVLVGPLGLPGHRASRSRSAPGSRRRSCSSCCGAGSPALGARRRSVAASAVRAARRGARGAAVAFAVASAAGARIRRRRPRRSRSARASRDRAASACAAVFVVAGGSPCGSPELPSIVGVMVDLAPPPAPSVSRRDPLDPDRAGTPSSRRAIPARTSSSRPGPQVKAVNGWSAHAASRPDGPQSAPRSSSAGRGRCRGLRLRAARPVSRTTGRRTSIARLHRAPSATSLPSGAGRVSHLRIDPEIELDGPLDPDGALRRALRAAGWRPGAADPADLDPDHRPARRRGRALGRPAQEVAPVRQQGADAPGSSSSTPRATGSASSTGSTARPPTGPASSSGPSRRIATSGRRSGRPAAPGCCSPRRADGEPLATLFLVRCGPRVVEPYGGMTPAGAESRANYLLKWEAIRHVPRAGRDELRPVGPRDRRHRPLQDRVRRPRGPLHRGVGPRARPARARASTRRADERGSGGRAGGTASPAAAARPPSGATPSGDAEWTAVRASRRRRSSRTGTRGPSTRPAAMSTSRGPGRSIGAASAGGRATCVFDDGFAVLALDGRWPLIGGAQRLPPARPDRRRRDRGARRADARLVASTDCLGRPGRRRRRDATPRSRPQTRLRRAARARPGFHPIEEIQPSRHRMSPAARRRTSTTTRVRAGIAQVDPPADPAAETDGPASSSRHDTARLARRCGGCSSAPPSRSARRSTASTTCCSSDRRAARQFQFGPRDVVRRLVAAAPTPPAISSTSRRATPRRRRRSAGSSCTATASGSRPSTRAIAPARATRPPGRAAPPALAGDPARDPRGPRRRWTSAGSTSRPHRREPREGEPMCGPLPAQALVRRRSGSS